MKTTRITLDLTDRQITKLRELMDALPLSGYVDLILPVLKALPLESADGSAPVTGSRSGQTPSAPGRAFSLTAFTPKGAAGKAAIEKLLATLPHTGDL